MQRADRERGDSRRSRETRRSPSTSDGLNPYSAKYCCIVSRRPRLSATISTRSRVAVDEALERSKRIVGAAVDLDRRQRRGRRLGRSSVGVVVGAFGAAISMRANALSAPLNSSGGRNSSVGGSSGRALSPRSSRSATRCPARSASIGAGDVAVQHDDRVRRQVVGERRGRLEEQRQVVLDAAGRDAVAKCPCRAASFDGSPSNTSRKRLRKRARPASSSGNSRAGSRRTSDTG